MIDFVKNIAIDFWATLAEMSPYLLFGFFIAGLLSVFVTAARVERHLGGAGFWQVFKASLLGVPLPLCSCGVIPVSMSLHKHGASKGATISFLLSTPQTGVDSILVTYSLMGPIFAIFRPLAAFITGLIGGVAVNAIENHHPLAEGKEQTPECTDSCCAHGPRQNKFIRAMKHGFITLPADIGRSMLIGLFIAALISALVPENYFAETILASGNGILAMLIMMVVGIPVYVCATASVPIAVKLIAIGLSPGAAFVFLMTGPATNAAALATLWANVGKRTAIVYLLTVIVCSLAGGLLLDAIFAGDVSSLHQCHEMLPMGFKHASAVVLLTVLGYGVYNKLSKKAGDH